MGAGDGAVEEKVRSAMVEWRTFEKHGIQEALRELERYQVLVGNNQYQIEVFVRLSPGSAGSQRGYATRVHRQVDFGGLGSVWVREPTVEDSDAPSPEEAVERCVNDLLEQERKRRDAETAVPGRRR